ncbi:MAG: DNA repair protein RecO [Desulfovibrio sp.]|nr:DNA repair protein RecO [Desulfovibrio sp.]MCA1985436.1 DNA repair protein RecO [Desulfovibrio sp.]
MVEYTDQALVLRVGRFKEADCWVKGYSPSQGVFTAFAFGGMRSRRRFCGCLDPLNLLSLRLKKEKGGRYVSLMETGLLAAPRRLRQDAPRLGMMMNCLKFLEALAPGPENAPAAFALATQTMAAFEECERLPQAFPALFRWRLTLDQGYRPELETCHACGASLRQGEESVRLALRDGRAFCARCGWNQAAEASHWLSRAAWDILCQAAETPPAAWGGREHRSLDATQWNSTQFSADDVSAAARAADRYVVMHTGVHWDRFGYRRS